MSLKGVTFDHQNITSKDMAHFLWEFAGQTSGVTKGCSITFNSATNAITVSAGYMLSHGRFSKVEGSESLGSLIPTFTEGTHYCRLIYRVDLTKINTRSDFQQGFWTVISGTDGYPDLTQEDLDDTGTVYDLPFAKFIVTSAGVTADSFIDDRIVFGASTLVTIPTTAWEGNGPYTATVNASTMIGNPTPSWSIEVPDNTADLAGANMLEAGALIGKLWTTQGVVHATAYGDKPESVIYIRIKE